MSDVHHDMIGAFRSEGLPTPPVPSSLRPALSARGEWCWATRDIDPLDMNMFSSELINEVLFGHASEYVAVSHAGHGVNSYGLNYFLVYRNLAIFMQVGWGGIYTNNAEEAQRLARLWDRCRALLELVDSRPPSAESQRWLLCLFSNFRGRSACGWVAPNTLPRPAEWFEENHRVVDVLAVAEQLLRHDDHNPIDVSRCPT